MTKLNFRMMQLTQIMMQLRRKDMKKAILAIIGALVFGKLTPVILLALLIVALVVIIRASIEEGKQW